MQKPRVLMLATTLPTEPGDGTPEFVLELARHMDADVTILAPRTGGCPARQQMGNVSVIRFRYGPRFAESLADDAILPAIKNSPLLALQVPGLLAGMAVALRRAMNDVQPDVVHAHWIIPAGLWGVVATAKKNTKLIVTAHGADAFALNDPISRNLKRFVLRRADRVHAVSSDIAEALRAIEPKTEVTVSPIGVDVASVAAATSTRKPNGRLLFVGRLAEKKGIADLLNALAVLRDQYGLLHHLDIVGDGPQRSDLHSLVSDLSLNSSVTFHGKKSRAEVLDFYRLAELLVMPSKTASNGDRDGTPVVLMEAIAAKLPIVATNVGGIGELLEDGETGWLTPEGDVASLADSIRRALNAPDAATVGDRCLRASEHRIDVARIGADLLRSVR